jgi:molecular chaperone IbpA
MYGQYDAFTIGFDKIFDRFKDLQAQADKVITYPPYNIMKTGENTFVIELALAGFSKQNVEIVLEENVLKITGKIDKTDPSDEKSYIFKGIANRGFTRSFTLADTVEINNAEMVNGMLRIFLESIVQQKKAKTIDISDKPSEPVQRQNPAPEPEQKLDYGYLTE